MSGDWRPEESHQNEKQQFRADVKYLSRMLKSPLKPIDPFKLDGTGLSFTLQNNSLYVSELFMCVLDAIFR